MEISYWYRVIGLYAFLHIVLFFVEWYRYKHSNWSWYGFREDGMLGLSYILMAFDTMIIILAIIGWAIFPIICH